MTLSSIPSKATESSVGSLRLLAATPAEATAVRLRAYWAGWHRRTHTAPTPAATAREDAAWLRLVEFVDAHSLTDTAFDPRD